MLHTLDFALTVSLNREMQRQTRTSTTKEVGGTHKEIALQTSNKVRNQGSGTYQHRIIQQDLLHKKQMTDWS